MRSLVFDEINVNGGNWMPWFSYTMRPRHPVSVESSLNSGRLFSHSRVCYNLFHHRASIGTGYGWSERINAWNRLAYCTPSANDFGSDGTKDFSATATANEYDRVTRFILPTPYPPSSVLRPGSLSVLLSIQFTRFYLFFSGFYPG